MSNSLSRDKLPLNNGHRREFPRKATQVFVDEHQIITQLRLARLSVLCPSLQPMQDSSSDRPELLFCDTTLNFRALNPNNDLKAIIGAGLLGSESEQLQNQLRKLLS